MRFAMLPCSLILGIFRARRAVVKNIACFACTIRVVSGQ
jgi:hypothetical protein